MDQLLTEIETIVSSGTKLNLQYHIDNILDEEQQEDVIDYFRSAETSNLEDAYEEFKDEGYSMEELQIMLIKFISEMAN